MPNVPFDDQFPIHRKVSPLSDAAFRLHTEAIFWCRRNRTDGRIASHELRSVSGISRPERQATELVTRGLWHEAGAECESGQCPASPVVAALSEGDEPDGWVIHDYFDFHPTRSKVLQLSEDRRKAGSVGGYRSGQTRRSRSDRSRSKREAKPKQVASSPPLLPPTGEGKGGGGAALRDGAPPPPRTITTTTGRILCETHRLEINDTTPCRGCAADAKVAAGIDAELDQRPPVPTRSSRTDPADASAEVYAEYAEARRILDALPDRDDWLTAARKHLDERGITPSVYRSAVTAVQLHRAAQQPEPPPHEDGP